MTNQSTTPSFCIITPTAYLGKYASQSSMHLVLAHLVDTDVSYAQWYRLRDEFKIMDCSTFELGTPYDPTRLIDLGHEVGADAIVLPDYPFKEGQKTIDAAESVLDDIKKAGFKVMFVPQSKRGDLEDWINCYTWAANRSDIDIIGMSILGIPNALPHIPAAYARVVMTQILMDRGLFDVDKYHHYLGLNSGPALEIPALIKMDALDSCDSSGPVWAGICGTMYSKMCDSYQPIRKISKHVDFNYPMVKDPYVHEAIQHNINLTLELF